MSQPASPSQAPASLPTSNGKFTHPASSSRASSQSSSETRSLYTPLYDQLDQLTTVIQHVGDDIQTCKTASEERHQVRQAREEEQKKRTASVQEQLAQMLAMTQESLRRKREEAASVAVRSGASGKCQRAWCARRTMLKEGPCVPRLAALLPTPRCGHGHEIGVSDVRAGAAERGVWAGGQRGDGVEVVDARVA